MKADHFYGMMDSQNIKISFRKEVKHVPVDKPGPGLGGPSVRAVPLQAECAGLPDPLRHGGRPVGGYQRHRCHGHPDQRLLHQGLTPNLQYKHGKIKC